MKRIIRKVRAVERAEKISALWNLLLMIDVFVAIYLVLSKEILRVLPDGYLSKAVELWSLTPIFILPLIISMTMTIFEDTSKLNHPEIQRLQIASNPESTAEELTKLSKDKESLVRLKIAQNPSTPAITLFQLFEEGGVIREAVVKNPNFNLDKYIDEFVKTE